MRTAQGHKKGPGDEVELLDHFPLKAMLRTGKAQSVKNGIYKKLSFKRFPMGRYAFKT